MFREDPMRRALTRRELLTTSATLALAAASPVRVLAGRDGLKREARPRVVEVRGPVDTALKLLLDDLGGVERFVRRGATVVVKPNMSFPTPPERATTTHPEVVRAVVRLCLEAGAGRVLVVDHPMRSTRLCLRVTGMEKACKGLEGSVHLFGAASEGMYEEVPVPEGRELRRVRVLRPLLESDLLINVPQMKSHSATTVSLGTKGNMGLIWERGSFHGRMNLNEAIGDLNTVVRARLTILDGTRVLTDGGPQGPGSVETPGCLIGGEDPVAVDAYGTSRVKWYGRKVEPADVGHLVACHRRGVGQIDLDRTDVRIREVTASSR